MIKKIFTTINDFLVAWSEYRYQQYKNRNFNSYYY